jgi:4-hydroxybenzoate polyprenyltransferase
MHSNGKSNMLRNWSSLLRVPNLAIIILTQYLLGYGIIRPYMMMQNVEPPLGHLNFFILVAVTVFIAAAGYIINDHFDVNTDRRNKPGRNVLEGKLSVRSALRVYYLLNAIAVAAGFYLAWKAGSFQLGLIFPAIAGLLWFYSSRYQRQAFWGNLIVAVLSAMVILIIWLFEFFMLLQNGDEFVSVMNLLDSINRYVWAYAFFAFLVTLIREMLKDIQDMNGDMAMGYRTLPVIWGIKPVRIIAALLIVICMALLALGQAYLYSNGMALPFWYLLIAVQSILAYLLYLLIRSGSSETYGFLANTAKIIMLAGILSMELIYISL